MKKLFSLIAVLGILNGCQTLKQSGNNQYQIFHELGIPLRFSGYEKKQTSAVIFNRNGDRIGIKNYELDGDGILDVREMYLLDEKADVMDFGNAKPFLYLWNIDSDSEFEDNESLFDPKKNGLSGDERWFHEIVSEGEIELSAEEMINRI